MAAALAATLDSRIEADVKVLRLPDGTYAERSWEPRLWHVPGYIERLTETKLLELIANAAGDRPTCRVERYSLPQAPQVIHDVLRERGRQDQLWGANRRQPGETWATILSEETGEVAKAVLSRDAKNLYEEVIQTAAVCFAIAEALLDDRLL